MTSPGAESGRRGPPGGMPVAKLTLRGAENSGARAGTLLAEESPSSQKAVPHRDRRAMTFMPHSLLVAAHPSRRWITFARHTVSIAGVLADAAAIIGVSVLMGSLY